MVLLLLALIEIAPGAPTVEFDSSVCPGLHVEDNGASGGACVALDMRENYGGFSLKSPELEAGWHTASLRLRLNKPRNPYVCQGILLFDIRGADVQATKQPGYKKAYVPIHRLFTPEWTTLDFPVYIPKRDRYTLEFLHDRGRPPIDLSAVRKPESVTFDAPALDGDESAGDLDALLGGGADGGLTLDEEDVLKTRPLILLDTVTFKRLDDTVSVRSVLTDKVFYQPGEAVSAMATVVNHAEACDVGVVAVLHWDLAQSRTVVPRRNVDLPAGGTLDIPLTWTLDPAEEKWGCELEVKVYKGEHVLATRRVIVPVATAVTRMLQFTFASPGKGLSTEPRENDFLNTLEVFAFWPDDWGDLTPEQDEWFSSQGGTRVRLADLERLIEQAHARGRRILYYTRFIAYGPSGFEAARMHPDWFWDIDASYDSFGLHFWDMIGQRFDKANLHAAFFTYGLRPRMSNPNVQAHMLEEWDRTTSRFGWDGLRNDGYWWIDEPDTHRMDDAASAAMIRRMKAVQSKRHPGFIFGVNTFNNFDVDEAYASGRVIERERGYGEMTETLKAICEGDGFALNEYGLNRMDWDTFVRKHVFITDFVLANGGQFHLHDNSNQERPRFGVYRSPEYHYVGVLNRAMGGHGGPDAPLHGDYDAFCMRYGGLLWNPSLTRVRSPESLLNVEAAADIWWKPFVKRLETDRQLRLVVQLINPPYPRVSDADWPDSALQRYRPPVDAIGVKVKIPEGCTPLRAWWATAEPTMQGAALDLHVEAGIVSVNVPRLNVWSMLVFDFDR